MSLSSSRLARTRRTNNGLTRSISASTRSKTNRNVSREAIRSVDQLEDLLSEPAPSVNASVARLDGDIIILGVAGKMGPSLARMIKRASDCAGTNRRVIGVARFSATQVEAQLRASGIETIQ